MIKAKISYKIKETHPDKDYVVGGWKPEMILTFEDKYRFDELNDNVKRIISDDLRLVAGGGYNDNHIYDVKITYRRVSA